MSPIDLERISNTIAWGARYIKVLDSSGTEKILKIKELDLEDRVWIDFVHKQAIAKAKEAGLLSERELAIFLDKQQVWTSKDEKDIKNHQVSIRKLKEELDGVASVREAKRLKKVISSTENSLNNKMGERSFHFSGTSERFVDDHRIKAIIFSVTLNSNGDKYWPTWDDFLEEDDFIFINNITSELGKAEPISTTEIRQIARSPSWRSKWLAAKNIKSLFGKPAINLTRNQETLVYWSQVYDNVYESLDRPSQDIIDDDDRLDKWFEEQRNKRRAEEITSGSSSEVNISKGVGKHGEIGIVTNKLMHLSDNPQDRGWGNKDGAKTISTESVNNLNDGLSKKFLSHQRTRLKEFGVIREEDLRENLNSRRVIGASDVVFEKRKRRDGYTTKGVVEKHKGGTLSGRRKQ